MAQIFVSYSRKDRKFAYPLVTDLSRLGADAWIDREDIRPSQDWADVIQRALDECRLMIVIVSPDSMSSPNVADEWKYYKSLQKPLLPILYKPAEMHFQLHSLQHIDFAHQPYPAAFEQLCAELRRQGVMPQAPISAKKTMRARSRPTPPRPARRRWPLWSLVGAGVGALIVLIALVVVIGLLRPDSDDHHTPSPGPTSTLPTGTTVHAVQPDSPQAALQFPNVWDTLDFVNLDLPGLRTYERTITPETLRWAFLWCGENAADLERLLKPFSIRFFIDDTEVPADAVIAYPLSDRCRAWATLLEGWQPGTRVQLDIRYTLTDTVSDPPDPDDIGEYIQRVYINVQ
jgi:hypothetical protein